MIAGTAAAAAIKCARTSSDRKRPAGSGWPVTASARKVELDVLWGQGITAQRNGAIVAHASNVTLGVTQGPGLCPCKGEARETRLGCRPHQSPAGAAAGLLEGQTSSSIGKRRRERLKLANAGRLLCGQVVGAVCPRGRPGAAKAARARSNRPLADLAS